MDKTVSSRKLSEKLSADPGVVIENFAKDHAVTPRQVVEALPDEMRRFAAGETFVDIMSDVATWGDVTVIVHTDDGIMEFTGAVPPGKVAQGYYNLSGRTGLHGHLRHERCSGVAFVERPFFGRLSASINFFNTDGGIMFKVFVGRDENRELLPNQLVAFRKLADRMCESVNA